VKETCRAEKIVENSFNDDEDLKNADGSAKTAIVVGIPMYKTNDDLRLIPVLEQDSKRKPLFLRLAKIRTFKP
jgi:hypothetical protein